MNATYIRDANCRLCIDTYPENIGEECTNCVALRTETVKVLEFVKGLFGEASAIILFKDGTLQMVPINKLRIQEEDR